MRNIISENKIINRWHNDFEKPVVSICCTTYNHECFIEDALEGILLQSTDYSYELLIHDDASTDNTAKIIREYEKKYPRIIKPIYQKDNQLSKGIRISPTFNFTRAKGEYIALCDGDDYWVDRDKLQKQILVMKRNKNTDISFHASYIDYYKDNINVHRKTIKYGNREKKISLKKLLMKDGDYIPTSSIVIRKNVALKACDFFTKHPDTIIGDYFIQIIGAARNGAIYIPDVMSCYRKNLQGSWSQRMIDVRENELEKWFEYRISIVRSLVQLKSTYYKNIKIFNIAISKRLYNIFMSEYILEKDKVALKNIMGKNMILFHRILLNKSVKKNVAALKKIIRQLKELAIRISKKP